MFGLGSDSLGLCTWKPAHAHAHRLGELVGAIASRPAAPDWYELPERVRDVAPSAARAVLGYGSWYLDGLRKDASFADAFLVVDDYARFHTRPFHAWMNRALPPNVYFLWSNGDNHRELRGKYNVISAADLERECGFDLRDVYNAGRLSKPVWIAWVRDEATRTWLVERLVGALCALTPIALGLCPERFSVDLFSLELLGLSYRGEARLEGWERVRQLHAVYPDYYTELHRRLLEAFADATGRLEPAGTGFAKRGHAEWSRITRASHRLIRRSRRRGYLRWPRIILTEPNLADLAANEAERKAGVRIEVTPRLRRHPLLYGLPEFLRVLRERDTEDRIR
jgi:hypothetical protein